MQVAASATGRSQEPTGSEAFLAIDADDRIVWINQAAEILLDHPTEDLIGRPVDSVLPGLRDRDGDGPSSSATAAGRRLAARRGDGTTVNVVAFLSAAESQDSGLAAVRLQYSSARSAVEEALWASRQHLRGLVNNAADAIVSVDSNGQITLFNPAAEATFGYKAEEVLGLPVTALMPERFRAMHGEHMARFARSGDTARPMGGRAQIWGLRKDGAEFPAEATISLSRVEGEIYHNVILRDVSERLRIEAELSAARTRSEEASRAKSEFLAHMSHELRTPLNAVIGFSEMIRDDVLGGLGNPVYRDYANDIHRSGHHLLALINDILDLSKIEAGKVTLEERAFDPLDAIDMCIHLVRERAAKQDVTIETRFADDGVRLRGDARRFKQIVLNLLSNAVKFTLAKGTVRISIERDGGAAWQLVVADSGIGMSAADIEKALEPFGRVENHLTRNIEGTGLGLPLVKSLCDLHGARLDIASAPGEGTTVSVTWPADRVIVPAAA